MTMLRDATSCPQYDNPPDDQKASKVVVRASKDRDVEVARRALLVLVHLLKERAHQRLLVFMGGFWIRFCFDEDVPMHIKRTHSMVTRTSMRTFGEHGQLHILNIPVIPFAASIATLSVSSAKRDE